MSNIIAALESERMTARSSGLRPGRHRRRRGEGQGRRPRARAGLRRRGHREEQPRPQLVVHRAQDLARRRRRARVPDATARRSARSRSSVVATSAAPSCTTCASARASPPASKRRSELAGTAAARRHRASAMRARLLHWIWSGLDGLRKILHLLLLLLIFGVIGALFSRPIPLVPDKAALVIAPQGPIVEQLTGDPLERAIAEILRQGPTRDAAARRRRRDRARPRNDERISSLYLDLGGLDGGGRREAAGSRGRDRRFRKTGKPVIAFGEYYDQPQYYLAAHADEIYLDPQGIVYVDGFANYGLFVKDALDKLVGRLERLPRRPVQVGGRDVHAQRHVARRARGEPRLAQLRLGHLQVRRGEGARLRAGGAAGLCRRRRRRAAQGRRRPGEDGARRRARHRARGTLRVEERLAEITGDDEDAHSFEGVDHRCVPRERRTRSEALSAEAGRQDRRHRRRRARSCRASSRRA